MAAKSHDRRGIFLDNRRYSRIKKGAEAPFVDLLAAVDPAVDLPAAAVKAPVGFRATSVQPPVDTITLAIQSLRKSVPASRVRATGLAIEIAIDPVAALIEAMLDPVALAVETRFHAVAGVGQSATGTKQKPGRNDDTLPYVHDPLPVGTTNCVML
jgi:hypothetical protein